MRLKRKECGYTSQVVKNGIHWRTLSIFSVMRLWPGLTGFYLIIYPLGRWQIYPILYGTSNCEVAIRSPDQRHIFINKLWEFSSQKHSPYINCMWHYKPISGDQMLVCHKHLENANLYAFYYFLLSAECTTM